MTRTPIRLTVVSNDEFAKIVHLFPTNDNVLNHNMKRLYSLRHPIAHSFATKSRNGNRNEDFSTEELDIELWINNNARVMLNTNLWIEVDLVNRLVGYIRNIVYKPGTAPPEPPAYATIGFDNYSGVPFDDHHPNIIPITPLQRGRTFQLPLKMAWALTIHKSQGLTLSKVTVAIGPRKRAGLTFATVCHVESLEGLRIMPPFTYDRYEKMKSGKQLLNIEVEECRLRSLENH